MARVWLQRLSRDGAANTSQRTPRMDVEIHVNRPLCLLAVVLVVGCSPPTRTESLTAKNLLEADPVADVQRATADDDYRFVAVMELGQTCPGAEDRPDAFEKFGVKLVKGTSDDAATDLEMNAVDYATIYNRLLMATIYLSQRTRLVA